MITPLPGVAAPALLNALRETETALSNLRGAGGTVYAQFDSYRRWADERAWLLGKLLSAEWVARLITTPRYWTAQALDPTGRSEAALAAFLDLELNERLRTFESTREELDRQIKRWGSRSGLIVVPDTNVYLHHDRYFQDVEWHKVVPARSEDVHLVVPLLVVDELDDRKRSPRNATVSSTNPEPVRTRARVTLRELDTRLTDPHQMATIKPSRFPESGAVTLELLMDDPAHIRLPRADDELVDRALALHAVTGRPIYLVAFDTGMAFRGRAARLKVVHIAEP